MGDAYIIRQHESSIKDVFLTAVLAAKFHLPKAILVLFYTATIVSILTSAVWFGVASSREKSML